MRPATVEEYLNMNLGRLPVKKLVAKLVEDIIDLYSFGESTQDQNRNKELRTLAENSKFRNTLEAVKYQMDERYQKLLTLYGVR